MCGIVGYTGEDSAACVLLDGLKELEYRGYDSSGVAIADGTHLFLEKKAGRIENLERSLAEKQPKGTCGIGHTRWATHGAATDENAHPFFSRFAKFAVVHNGIITNYPSLAESLRARGVILSSETDSEVVAHLIDLYYTGDVLSAIRRTVRELTGSFALGVISVYEPGVVYGVRKDSPLILGKGKRGNYLCSDLSGISEYCEKYYALFNGEERGFQTEPVPKQLSTRSEARTGSYMLSEIREVPSSLALTLENYPEEEIKAILSGKIGRFCLIGCGSAYHAALLFKRAMRELFGMDAEAYIASEFLTERWDGADHPLVIAVSQSGETADTLQAARKAKEEGATLLCVCNVRTSSLVRLCDKAVITCCGEERAVAATKSYAAQAVTMLALCLSFAEISGKTDKNTLAFYKKELALLPEKAQAVIGSEKEIAQICLEMKDASAVFFLGRNADHDAAKEGSLKLKEVSYVFSEAYPAGELKHGTLALMEQGIYCVMVSTDERFEEKNASSVAEVGARGARTLSVVCEKSKGRIGGDHIFRIPDCPPVFSPVVSCVAMQYIAYFIAKYRGCDTDKPRNLAKSVTVE